jgi:hypothetical protein
MVIIDNTTPLEYDDGDGFFTDDFSDDANYGYLTNNLLRHSPNGTLNRQERISTNGQSIWKRNPRVKNATTISKMKK